MEQSGWSTPHSTFSRTVSSSSSMDPPGPPSMFSDPRRMPCFLIQPAASLSWRRVVFLRNTSLRMKSLAASKAMRA